MPASFPGIPDFTVEEADPAGAVLPPITEGDDGTAQDPAEDEPLLEPADDVEAPPRPEPPPPTPPDESPGDDEPSSRPPGGPAIVTFDPSYLAAPVRQEFTTSIVISGAENVGSVPFHLAFDPEYLEYIGASKDSPFLGQGATPVFVLATVSGNGRELIVGLSRQGNRPGANGQGTLIDFLFRTRKAGTTTLHFTDLSVLNPRAQPLPFDKLGMTVVIQ